MKATLQADIKQQPAAARHGAPCREVGHTHIEDTPPKADIWCSEKSLRVLPAEEIAQESYEVALRGVPWS